MVWRVRLGIVVVRRHRLNQVWYNSWNSLQKVYRVQSSRRCYVMNRGDGSRSDKPGVIKNFFDNVRQGLEKNKEMQVLGE